MPFQVLHNLEIPFLGDVEEALAPVDLSLAQLLFYNLWAHRAAEEIHTPHYFVMHVEFTMTYSGHMWQLPENCCKVIDVSFTIDELVLVLLEVNH